MKQSGSPPQRETNLTRSEPLIARAAARAATRCNLPDAVWPAAAKRQPRAQSARRSSEAAAPQGLFSMKIYLNLKMGRNARQDAMHALFSCEAAARAAYRAARLLSTFFSDHFNNKAWVPRQRGACVSTWLGEPIVCLPNVVWPCCRKAAALRGARRAPPNFKKNLFFLKWVTT